jgi:transcriptional regulator with XRE-family HTH domain
MFNHIGQKIRATRIQKGIGLNALASKLGVSPAYLSNLENGKSETLQISFLNNLERELGLSPCDLCYKSDGTKEDFSSFLFRVNLISNKLKELEQDNPGAAHYLASIVEEGISQFSNQTS